MGNYVSVIDGATLEVIDTVPIGDALIDVAYDPVNNRVYTPLQSDTVSVIDAATLEVIDTVPVGQDPVAIAIDPVNNRVFVTNNDFKYCFCNRRSYSRGNRNVPVGVNPNDIAYDSVNNRAYVANSGSNSVSVIDLQ